MTETLIRSLEGRKLKLHRQLPKTESLKDCMDRTIPYFKVRMLRGKWLIAIFIYAWIKQAMSVM